MMRSWAARVLAVSGLGAAFWPVGSGTAHAAVLVTCTMDTWSMHIADPGDGGAATGSASGSCVSVLPGVEKVACTFTGTGTFNLLAATSTTTDVCVWKDGAGVPVDSSTLTVTRTYAGAIGVPVVVAGTGAVTGGQLLPSATTDTGVATRTAGSANYTVPPNSYPVITVFASDRDVKRDVTAVVWDR